MRKRHPPHHPGPYIPVDTFILVDDIDLLTQTDSDTLIVSLQNAVLTVSDLDIVTTNDNSSTGGLSLVALSVDPLDVVIATDLIATVPPSGALLETLTLVNAVAITQPANFFPQMVGLQFKKGDIPAGTYPQLRLNDGITNILATFTNLVFWNDGSLSFCGCLPRIPITVPASGSIFIKVFAGGSTPAVSGFTHATLTSNTDLKLVGTGIQKLLGTQTSSFNTGIAGGDVWDFGNGPTALIFGAYQAFNDGAANSPQTGVWHYAQVMKDVSGGIFGYRYIGKFHNGWHDVTVPQIDVVAFQQMFLKNGTTNIREIKASTPDQTLSWIGQASGTADSGTTTTMIDTGSIGAGSSYYVGDFLGFTSGPNAGVERRITGYNTSTGAFTCLAFANTISSGDTFYITGSKYSVASTTGMVDGICIYATTNGAGLFTSTPYYIRVINSTKIHLHTTLGGAKSNNSGWFIGSAGSVSIRACMALNYYAAEPYTCGPSCLYDFVAGTGVETTCWWKMDNVYAKSTKMFGPIDLTIAPTAITARNYAIETWDDWLVYEDSSGPRPDIGYITGQSTAHFILQTASALQTVRKHGLQTNMDCWSLRRSATRNSLDLLDTDYTGLSTRMPHFCLRPSNTASNSLDVNAPADWAGHLFDIFDFAHKPEGIYYAAVVTGEPHYLDSLHDRATAGLCNADQVGAVTGRGGQIIVGAQTFNRIVLRDGQQRSEAWQLRGAVYSYAITPTNYHGVTNFKGYWGQICNENMAYLVAEKASGTAFSQSVHVYPGVRTDEAVFEQDYLCCVFCMDYVFREDPNSATAILDFHIWKDSIRTQEALFWVTAYYWLFVGKAKNITGWNQVLYNDAWGGGSVTWNAGTDIITNQIPNALAGVPATGDAFAIGASVGTPLGGVTSDTIYFIRDLVNVSGFQYTYKLAATPGGAVVDITTTGSQSNDNDYGRHAGASNTTLAGITGGEGSYPVSCHGVMNFARAVGITLPAGFEAAINAGYSPPVWSSNPVMALTTSF